VNHHDTKTRNLLVFAALGVSVLGCIFAPTVTSQSAAGQDEVVRVDTDLTNLFFTAVDKRKQFVTTLGEADLQVLEDGIPQEILMFQKETNRPVSIALLIDVSSSEARTLPQEKAAARLFIEAIIKSKEDEVAIIPFAELAFLEQPFTDNVLQLYRVLSQLEIALPNYLGSGPPIRGVASRIGAAPPPGTTALWESVAVTAEIMAARVGNRRRAIILLSDGYDTTSRVQRSMATEQALTSETIIYGIGIGDEREEGVHRGAIRNLAEATGGRAFFPKNELDLKGAFTEIEREMRSQYLVAYSSTNKNRDGSFRQMKIEVRNPALRKEIKVRHRPGYFARRLGPSSQSLPVR
jgi:VWFA-related protein